MQRITDAQRRARVVRRHLLAPAHRVADPADVAAAVVGLHASDPATVHLSAMARLAGPAVAAVEAAIYDDRSVVRMLGMRRTMFVVPRDAVGVVQAAATDDVAARERRRLLGFLADDGVADPDGLLAGLEEAALAAIRARGGARTTDLADDVPGLRREVTVGSGRWRTAVRLSSRVVAQLAAEGHIVRGRPLGSWLSSQYTWAPTDAWLGGTPDPVDADAARADLATRWLRRFGPGTVADLKWWTGWTLTTTRRVLDDLDTATVALDDGSEALVLADDRDEDAPTPPAAALLPGLDPTPMGWTQRDWYLGDHRAALFDRNGNVGPTIWWDGRIVGGWAQHADGTVATELLTDAGSAAAEAVDAEAARLTGLLDGVCVTPRFRTPLERRLAS